MGGAKWGRRPTRREGGKRGRHPVKRKGSRGRAPISLYNKKRRIYIGEPIGPR